MFVTAQFTTFIHGFGEKLFVALRVREGKLLEEEVELVWVGDVTMVSKMPFECKLLLFGQVLRTGDDVLGDDSFAVDGNLVDIHGSLLMLYRSHVDVHYSFRLDGDRIDAYGSFMLSRDDRNVHNGIVHGRKHGNVHYSRV